MVVLVQPREGGLDYLKGESATQAGVLPGSEDERGWASSEIGGGRRGELFRVAERGGHVEDDPLSGLDPHAVVVEVFGGPSKQERRPGAKSEDLPDEPVGLAGAQARAGRGGFGQQFGERESELGFQ